MVVAKDWRHYFTFQTTSTMPGPRAKQNGAKKTKTKAVSIVVVDPPAASLAAIAALPPALQPRTLTSLDELSTKDWDEVVRIICDHVKIPGRFLARMALPQH